MRAYPDRVPAGTKPTDSQLRHENARLEREVARLRLKLEHAEKLHRVQKRLAEMMEELDRAWIAHPERSLRGRPVARQVPGEVWINRPEQEPASDAPQAAAS
jgi:hypothetical protein